MFQFFQGWRRKLGCVVLVLSAAFMLGWVRSLLLADFIGLPSRATTVYFVSHDGLLEFQWTTQLLAAKAIATPQYGVASETTAFATARPWFWNPPPVIWGTLRLQWYAQRSGLRVGGVDVVWVDYEVESQRSLGRFRFVSRNDGSHQGTKIVLPYWGVTIPLTILSAYLILWMPPKPSTRQVPDTSAT